MVCLCRDSRVAPSTPPLGFYACRSGSQASIEVPASLSSPLRLDQRSSRSAMHPTSSRYLNATNQTASRFPAGLPQEPGPSSRKPLQSPAHSEYARSQKNGHQTRDKLGPTAALAVGRMPCPRSRWGNRGSLPSQTIKATRFVGGRSGMRPAVHHGSAWSRNSYTVLCQRELGPAPNTERHQPFGRRGSWQWLSIEAKLSRRPARRQTSTARRQNHHRGAAVSQATTRGKACLGPNARVVVTLDRRQALTCMQKMPASRSVA